MGWLKDKLHTGRRTNLDEAIATGREAVASVSPDHPDYFACRGTLGLALQERFGYTGQPVDLDGAIAAAHEAIAALSPRVRSTNGTATVIPQL